MPRERKFLGTKPGKDALLVKTGRRKAPETVQEVMRDMQTGGQRTGFLKGENLLRKPDYIPTEELDSDGLLRKRLIQKLLAQWIFPNPLSSKSTPEMDRRSLVNKLNKSTLAELEKFLPDGIKARTNEELQDILKGEGDIGEEEKAGVQQLYMEISP